MRNINTIVTKIEAMSQMQSVTAKKKKGAVYFQVPMADMSRLSLLLITRGEWGGWGPTERPFLFLFSFFYGHFFSPFVLAFLCLFSAANVERPLVGRFGRAKIGAKEIHKMASIYASPFALGISRATSSHFLHPWVLIARINLLRMSCQVYILQ